MDIERTRGPWIKALPNGTKDGYRVCCPDAVRVGDDLCALAINRSGFYTLLLEKEDGWISEIGVSQSFAESCGDTASVIKHRRSRKGWKQIDLANAVGVDKQAVWYWENGYRSPSGASLERLQKALGEFPAELANTRA